MVTSRARLTWKHQGHTLSVALPTRRAQRVHCWLGAPPRPGRETRHTINLNKVCPATAQRRAAPPAEIFSLFRTSTLYAVQCCGLGGWYPPRHALSKALHTHEDINLSEPLDAALLLYTSLRLWSPFSPGDVDHNYIGQGIHSVAL